MLGLITCREVNTIGLGILHVLVLAHSPWVVLNNQIARCLTRWYRHQCNHIIHLIIITRKRHGQIANTIFRTESEIVGGLCLQITVSEIEEHPVHITHILIMQFLGGGSLIALTPCSP